MLHRLPALLRIPAYSGLRRKRPPRWAGIKAPTGKEEFLDIPSKGMSKKVAK